MKDVRMFLPVVGAVLVILGGFAVQGHADKPAWPPGQSKPGPIEVRVAGAIAGQGDPYVVCVAFVDNSLGELANSYVANPDYPPALEVTGPGRVHRRLTYYYCDHPDHEPPEGICTDPGGDHDPEHYKCLAIYEGIEDKKTGQVVFPVGNSWRITQKVVSETGAVSGIVVATGTLAAQATYEVLQEGTP